MSLSLEEARSISDKGLAEADKLGIKISLAVLDQYGGLVQLDRMDGARLMTPNVAEAKANTALNFHRPTSEVSQMPADRLASLAAAAKITVVMSGGGVPIVRDGAVYGAIGISGGTPEQDEQIANAAIS